MAKIISLKPKSKGDSNLITSHPLEFRRGDWHNGFALMCTRDESRRYEAHRSKALQTEGHQHIASLPNHFRLDGGYHFTILGLFRHRQSEAVMRRVYRLAGLMETVTNAPSPVLRTDLLRRFYQSILDEREELDVVWRGNIHQFLLPLHPELYDPARFIQKLACAESLKELYDTVDSEANIQFDICSRFYVFYVPQMFLNRESQ